VRQPIASAVHPNGDSLYILDDRGNATIHVFDRDRRYVRQLSIEGRATDIAVDGDGNIILSADVETARLAQVPDRVQVVTAAFSPAGERLQILRTATIDSAFSRRIILPHNTPVKVAANVDWVAMHYPVGGIVDLFRRVECRKWDFSHTVAVCMPEHLESAYRDQFEAVDSGVTNIQAWFSLISDVALMSNGDVWTLTLMLSPEGAMRLERYTATGARRESYELQAETRDLEDHSDSGILISPVPVAQLILFDRGLGRVRSLLESRAAPAGRQPPIR
jgi:hypothetical protein